MRNSHSSSVRASTLSPRLWRNIEPTYRFDHASLWSQDTLLNLKRCWVRAAGSCAFNSSQMSRSVVSNLRYLVSRVPQVQLNLPVHGQLAGVLEELKTAYKEALLVFVVETVEDAHQKGTLGARLVVISRVVRLFIRGLHNIGDINYGGITLKVL